MKRIISTILVCVLLLGCVFTLASCGKKLKGTYVAKQEMYGQSVEVAYTFDGDKISAEMTSTIAGVTNTTKLGEGTYEIDGDKIKITIEMNGETESQEFSFEKGKDYIKIDGDQYDKVKK